jgi:hypothetical protein
MEKYKGWIGQTLSGGVSIVKKLKLGTAVDSDIAIIIITSPVCIIAYIITRFWPLLIIAVAPLLLYLRHYGYWMKHRPEYLRTEKHQENILKIQTGAMGEKDDIQSEEAIDILPVTIAGSRAHKSQRIGSGK